MPDADGDRSARPSASRAGWKSPRKGRDPVTEVTGPLGFPVSITSTAGNATLYASPGNGSGRILALP